MADPGDWLSAPSILVTIIAARGSTPREAGTSMLVGPRETSGTIGGGQLEHRAITAARAMLARGETVRRLVMPLGPALAQCCGGSVTLSLEAVTPAVQERLRAEREAEQERLPRVLLFGAGHVGRALARALAPLPLRLTWVDERPEAFPPVWPAGVEVRWHMDPVRVMREAPAGAHVVVMTHSHPRDLDLVAAALERGDLGYVGLIGSATKRARFERRLGALGIPAERVASLVCPIGLAGIAAKEPAVIAASVAAELLLVFERAARCRSVPVRQSVA
ncbi:MAG TPA: xanthine dehydrogenase accessory protein XdhC [Geminicoccaceae bacterium]|nr:xanthine dehydrogenase accessory protein XdhC [Geminicoccaceae bacterium]